jgi:hypothetical protein
MFIIELKRGDVKTKKFAYQISGVKQDTSALTLELRVYTLDRSAVLFKKDDVDFDKTDIYNPTFPLLAADTNHPAGEYDAEIRIVGGADTDWFPKGRGNTPEYGKYILNESGKDLT